MFIRKFIYGRIDRDVNITVKGEVLTIDLVPNETSSSDITSRCVFDLDEFKSTRPGHKREGNHVVSNNTSMPEFTLYETGDFYTYHTMMHANLFDMSVQMCIPFLDSPLSECTLDIRTDGNPVKLSLDGVGKILDCTDFEAKNNGFDFTIPYPTIVGSESIYAGESEGYTIQSLLGFKDESFKGVWTVPMRKHRVYLSCSKGDFDSRVLDIDEDGIGEFTYYSYGTKSGDIVTLEAGLKGRPAMSVKRIYIL